MPYIKEDIRKTLDDCIEYMVTSLSLNTENNIENLSNQDLLNISGNINYCFSRVIGKLINKPSYAKIAIMTGVLENIKQEFYRRVGVNLEDKKILENGDISEYGRL